MRAALIALWLSACSDPVPAPVATDAGVWIDQRKVETGTPVVLHAPDGTPLPEVEGLTFTPSGPGVWEVRGGAGSYHAEIGGVQLFFDIGVDGPVGGEMDDLASLPPPAPPVWPWVLASVATAGLLSVAAWKAWQRWKPIPPPPTPEPPGRVARRAWALLRADTSLSPEPLALELSAVYRRYLDATHKWPATSRTTREILDNLAGELTALHLDRARRLLSAMDLVKFSERQAHADLFDALDADFDALVDR